MLGIRVVVGRVNKIQAGSAPVCELDLLNSPRLFLCLFLKLKSKTQLTLYCPPGPYNVSWVLCSGG